MRKTLTQALLAAFCAILVRGTFAAQMGGGCMIAAAHHSMLNAAKARGLWVWPVSWVDASTLPASVSPNTTWTPDTNAWYGSFIISGYLQKSVYRGTFTSNSLTVTNAASGYGVARFVSLLGGDYRISYDCTAVSEFRFSFYKPVDGGYKIDYYRSYGSSPAGACSKDIVIPNGYLLAIVFYSSGAGGTFTNINIEKI